MMCLAYEHAPDMAKAYRDRNGIGCTTVWRESPREWYPVQCRGNQTRTGWRGDLCRSKAEATKLAIRMAGMMDVPFIPLPRGMDCLLAMEQI